MDKKTRNRSRHQDLSETSDETLNGDLRTKIRLPVNRKKIFLHEENDKVKLRPSVVKKNMIKFVSSTPMCSSKKRFSNSLCISPIENDERPMTRLRRRSSSLQKHVVSSTSDGVCSKTSNNQNNSKCFVNNKSGSYTKKGTVHSNRKILSHDSTVNKTQIENSLLAETLPSSSNYSENENEILMKSTQLNNDKKKSKKSQIAQTFSTHVQTSFPITPVTVTKQSILTQTVVDKATQITDSLEKQTAVNQNDTVINDSDEHEYTLTNPVNLSKNNEKTTHLGNTKFNNMARKSKDMSLTCMCHSVNNVQEKPNQSYVNMETDDINTNKGVVDEKWLSDLLAQHLKDEISDISDVTYQSDGESIQSWQRRLVVSVDRCDFSKLKAKHLDKQAVEKSNTKGRKNTSGRRLEEKKELENKHTKSGSSGVTVLRNELLRPGNIEQNVKQKPVKKKKDIKNTINAAEDSSHENSRSKGLPNGVDNESGNQDKVESFKKRKSNVSIETTKRKRSMLINDDEISDSSVLDEQAVEKSNTKDRKNTSRKRLEENKELENKRTKSASSGVIILRNELIRPGNVEQNVKQKPVKKKKEINNSINPEEDSSEENTPSKDLPNGVYNESGSQDKVESFKKRKSNVSIETTKRKRSMLINDDEISDSSVLDEQAVEKSNTKGRKNTSRKRLEENKELENKRTKSASSGVIILRNELIRPGNVEQNVKQKPVKKKKEINNSINPAEDSSEENTPSKDLPNAVYNESGSQGKVESSKKRKSNVSIETTKRKRTTVIYDDEISDSSVLGVGNLSVRNQSSKLNNILRETVERTDNISWNLRSHTRNTSTVSITKGGGKLDSKENENENYADLNTDILHNSQNKKNSDNNKQNSRNSADSGKKNKKTKGTSKRNQKTKQRQPIKDIEIVSEVVEDDTQSRGEIEGVRRSKRNKKERVRHYDLPVLYTWEKGLVGDTKQNAKLYSSYKSQISKIQELCETQEFTEKRTRTKKVSQKNAVHTKTKSSQVNNKSSKSKNVHTNNVSQVDGSLEAKNTHTAKTPEANANQFYDVSSNSRNVNSLEESSIIDNGLGKHLVNVSNNDRFSNKNISNDISESLKENLEHIQHTETGGTSGCIQRGYFYFPQNNGVHKLDWCTSFPNLDKLDKNGCLRIGPGTKSFQSGYQSGYLEISPGESKPRDMLKKFSMLFVVLSGVGEFEVHDSYQILDRWSTVSVPLGAYYCIRNKSNSEKLLLLYVKIKPRGDN